MRNITFVKSRLSLCLAIFFLFAGYSVCFGQRAELEDVVYLKNGSIVRGTIIEQIPGKKLKIRTSDGDVLKFKMDEVERVVKDSRKLLIPVQNNEDYLYENDWYDYPDANKEQEAEQKEQRKRKLYFGWNIEKHKSTTYVLTNTGIIDSTLIAGNYPINRFRLRLTLPFSTQIKDANFVIDMLVPFATKEELSDTYPFGASQAQFASKFNIFELDLGFEIEF